MKKDSKEYEEKMKALYRKVAGTSLLIQGVLEEDTTNPSKKPTKPTDTEKQSK